MTVIPSTLGALLISLGFSGMTQAVTPVNVTVKQLNGGTKNMSMLKERNVQYETYYNSRFDYAVKYPSNIVTPQPPPTNNDGREFVSPDRDIEMAVYGRHQLNQSLNELYREALQRQRQLGSNVTYDYLGRNEFIISGYDRTGEVFYQKTLLHYNDFLTLDLNYERSLQPEFDSVVAEISNSFHGINERQIQVYFPTEGGEFTDVEPVIRTTDRVDVATFAIEQLIEGPRDAEEEQGLVNPIQLSGESVCGNQDFTISIEDNMAIVQFCRDVIRGGVGDDARLEEAIKTTLTQFSTVDEVVLLDKNGNCLIDFQGRNECLEKLPESAR